MPGSESRVPVVPFNIRSNCLSAVSHRDGATYAAGCDPVDVLRYTRAVFCYFVWMDSMNATTFSIRMRFIRS
jgi:hypothetical protein